MKIAIVDDQEEFLEINLNKLQQLNFDYLQMYTYLSVSDMEKSNIDFDLVLLDIDMPNIDGIVYAKEHKELNIIFMTSMGDRVKEAFGTNVYGFMEKSDSIEDFIHKIKIIISDILNRKYISLKVEDGIQSFLLEEIIYIQYLMNRNISLVYRGKSYVVKNNTLSNLEKSLDNMFLYTDRNTMVNIRKITGVIAKKVILNGVNQQFEISRRRLKEFSKYM